MNKLFIDSDILIDLLAQRENYLQAAALMSIIMDKKAAAYTTPLILANVDYIITKYSNKIKSRKAIKTLNKIITVIPIDEKIVNKALESEFSDFEDAIQCFAAEKEKINFIITRNKKDYKKGKIKVITAQEYITMYEAKDF